MNKQSVVGLKRELLMLLHYTQNENKTYAELLRLGRQRAKKLGFELREVDRILKFIIDQERKNNGTSR